MAEHSHSSTLAGWREWVQLPAIGVPWIKAKLDTGAQSSALHAASIEEFDRDGAEWVRFTVRPWQATDDDSVQVELPVQDRRRVRSSTGHTEDRLVVLLPVVLLGQEVAAEVTLTERSSMVFRMLIGREALRRGFTVSSRDSYLGGRPKRAIRRRNRGRPE